MLKGLAWIGAEVTDWSTGIPDPDYTIWHTSLPRLPTLYGHAVFASLHKKGDFLACERVVVVAVKDEEVAH